LSPTAARLLLGGPEGTAGAARAGGGRDRRTACQRARGRAERIPRRLPGRDWRQL